MPYVEHVKLWSGDFLVARAAPYGSAVMSLHGAALVPAAPAVVAITQPGLRETAEGLNKKINMVNRHK